MAYKSNLTQQEKDDVAAKSREATRSKFRKIKEFFTKKGKTPAISDRAKKIKQDQADVEKELPRGKPAPNQMEDYDKTKTAVASNVGKAAGKAAATSGVATAAGKAAAKKVPTSKRVMAGLSEFGKAFAQARKEGKKDFTFRDRQYAAVTKQEVEKAGASGLGDYLNKLKRSSTEIAKAPGQITSDTFKKGGSVMARGCKLGRKKPTKMY